MPDGLQIKAQTQTAAELSDVSPKAIPTKHRRDRTPRLYLLIFCALTGLAQMAQVLKGKPICNVERLRVTTQTKAARGL